MMGRWNKPRRVVDVSMDAHPQIRALLREGDHEGARRLFASADCQTVAMQDKTKRDGSQAPEGTDLRAQALTLLRHADASDAAEKWNAFQDKNRDATIDLSGVDFTPYPFPQDEAGRPVIDGYDFSTARLVRTCFAGMVLRRINLDYNFSAYLCDFRGARFEDVKATATWFDYGTFDDATFHRCRFERCDFIEVSFDGVTADATSFAGSTFYSGDLSDATFTGCNFDQLPWEDEESPPTRTRFDFSHLERTCFSDCTLPVSFNDSHLDHTDFAGSDLTGASFFKTVYVRRELHGRLLGVKGIETITGDPDCREDLINQVYFDDRQFDDREERRQAFLAKRENRKVKEGNAAQGPIAQMRRLMQRFQTPHGLPLSRSVSIGGFGWGLLWGSILALIVADFSPAQLFSPLSLGAILPTALLLSFISSRRGRNLGFRFWRLLDYGRDWDRVLVLAMTVIVLIGFLYAIGAPTDLCYVQSDIVVPPSAMCEPENAVGTEAQVLRIYPWYVATIGFATLGIVDLVDPRTTIGALIISINALAGYAVLGLFLAVVQASFLRRHPRSGH